ncbi:MAG: serine hydrolase [Steroidobacteraceae bacterium]
MRRSPRISRSSCAAPAPRCADAVPHGGAAESESGCRHHLDSEHAAFDPAPFVARILAESLRHRGRPGRAYRYSNVGYLWLGLLLERISGRAYVDQACESLIAPLQLEAHERLGFAIDDLGHHACGCVPRWSLLNPLLGLFIDRRRYIEGRSGRWLQLRRPARRWRQRGGPIGNALGLGRYLRALLGDSGYLPAGARVAEFERRGLPGAGRSAAFDHRERGGGSSCATRRRGYW